MAAKTETAPKEAGTAAATAKVAPERKSRKDVPGNFSYTKTIRSHGVLVETYADDWWGKHVPESVRSYAKANKDKESKEGLPPRSKNLIDYLTFGHLGEIIKANWDIFAGLFPNCEIERLEKVISRLNIARGPIAHCGYLPEDEVVRLKLAIRDWYALAE